MSNNSASRARPIHQLHRPLRDTPDEAEPSYSYEQESFLAQKEDDVEDAFFQKQKMNRRDSSGSQGSANNHLYKDGSKGSNGTAAAAGAGGSFWRMEQLQNSGQSPHGRSAVLASPSQPGRTRNLGSNQLKKAANGSASAASLLGAALNASSGASTASESSVSGNDGVRSHTTQTWLLMANLLFFRYF
jgi:hypothetical protein